MTPEAERVGDSGRDLVLLLDVGDRIDAGDLVDRVLVVDRGVDLRVFCSEERGKGGKKKEEMKEEKKKG